MRQYTEFGKKQREWDRMFKKCVPVGFTKNPDAPKPKKNKPTKNTAVKVKTPKSDGK